MTQYFQLMLNEITDVLDRLLWVISWPRNRLSKNFFPRKKKFFQKMRVMGTFVGIALFGV